MYVLASHIAKLPIISLQIGQTVATSNGLITEGGQLSAMAIRCKTGKWNRQDAVIILRDIRQIARDCILINSFEDIEDIGEIVRLKKAARENVVITGKKVVTEGGSKLGYVDDYSFEVDTGKLHKLYVQQSLMKSLLFNNLVIDQGQIVRHDSTRIIVKDAVVPASPPVRKTKPLRQPAV